MLVFILFDRSRLNKLDTMLVFNCGPLMRQKPAGASSPLNAIIQLQEPQKLEKHSIGIEPQRLPPY